MSDFKNDPVVGPEKSWDKIAAPTPSLHPLDILSKHIDDISSENKKEQENATEKG